MLWLTACYRVFVTIMDYFDERSTLLDKIQNTDSKQENGRSPVISQPQASTTPISSTASENTKPFVSWGKRIHNEITYRGIDWLVNSSIGVAFTYWTARTHSGEKYFGKPVGNFFKKILKPFLKSEAQLNEGAKWGTMFTSIMAGGTTIIPPMMLLESKNVKKKIIRDIDEIVYGKEAVRNDPKFEESYCLIDEEPKKSFKAGMAARFIALAPLIAIASIPATNRPMIKYLYDPIGNATKWTAEKLGIRPKGHLLETQLEAIEHHGVTKNRAVSNWDFIHRTIGFDFGLTIFYAVLHEVAYKGLATFGLKREKKIGKKEHLEANKCRIDHHLPISEQTDTSTQTHTTSASLTNTHSKKSTDLLESKRSFQDMVRPEAGTAPLLSP